jgi:luciferase family oxidoreductase group 1
MDSEQGFINQLAELSAIFKGTVPPGHHLEGEVANPTVPTAPEMWVLGSSSGGAAFAAHLGMQFAFAHFINAYSGAETAQAYRTHFRPGHDAAPRIALAILAVCTRSDEETKAVERAMMMRWALMATGHNRPIPTMEEGTAHDFTPREQAIAARDRPRATIGSPAFVAGRIRELKTEFGADEVILVAMMPSYELRTFTCEALATEFNLTPRV